MADSEEVRAALKEAIDSILASSGDFDSKASSAFGSFKRAVEKTKDVKPDASGIEILEGAAEKYKVLDFLFRFATEKRMQSRQVQTVLDILMRCDSWCKTFRDDSHLKTRVPSNWSVNLQSTASPCKYVVGQAVEVLRSDYSWSPGTMKDVQQATLTIHLNDGNWKRIPMELASQQVRSLQDSRPPQPKSQGSPTTTTAPQTLELSTPKASPACSLGHLEFSSDTPPKLKPGADPFTDKDGDLWHYSVLSSVAQYAGLNTSCSA